jgi:hypothetical protein
MSTQTGESYISAASGTGQGISAAAKNWITVSKVSLVRFNTGLDVTGTSTNWLVSDMDILGTNASPAAISTLVQSVVTLRQCIAQSTVSTGGVNTTTTVGTMSGSLSTTLSFAGVGSVLNLNSAQTIGTNSAYPILLDINSGANNSTINVGKIGGLGGTVWSSNIFNITSGAICNNNTIRLTDAITVASQATNSLLNSQTGMNTKIYCNNQSISARQYVFNNTFGVSTGNIIYDGPANTANLQGNSDVTFVNISTSRAYSAPVFAASSSGFARFVNVGGSVTDQRTTYPSTFGSIVTDTTTRHTASGVSWKMNVANSGTVYSPTEGAPLTLPVAKIAVNASASVTATVWVYRTNDSIVTKFVCPGGQIAGVASDVVATASGAINTWEQLTITFTPTQQGVVALEIDCYGDATGGATGITGDVYVDDFGASQA